MNCDTTDTEEIMQISIQTNNNSESNKNISLNASGDICPSESDLVKAPESREERIKRLKEESEEKIQRKNKEILESQKQSNELRQRQQEDRRKKIEELKQREEDRKKKVEQRRQEMDAKEREKNESSLRRTKEREARAAILQKQIRASAAMTQSMISSPQNRMTVSVHSSGASSGSEKCTTVYNRSSSGFDVDRVSNYVSQAAGCRAASVNTPLTGTKRPQVPEGCIEVDGNFIPANMRHAGCFVPYKGPHYRVKGVLAWGPPPDRVSPCGSSVAWWAALGGRSDRPHPRAASAHSSFIDCRGHSHGSTPHNLHKIALEDDQMVDIDITSLKTERSVSDAAQIVKGTISVKLLKARSLRYIGPPNGKESPSPRPKNRSTDAAPPNRGSRQPNPRSVITSAGDQSIYDRLCTPRSGSQPPKIIPKVSMEATPKSMTTSFTKQPPKMTPRVPPVTNLSQTKKPVTVTKTVNEKKQLPPNSAPDSGLASSPVSEMEPPREPSKEAVPNEEVAPQRTNPRRSGKHSQNKEADAAVAAESGTTEAKGAATVKEEDVYRLKLTEQRRLAREVKEKQQEEQRRLEEEARHRALEEKKRIEEETRQMVEEEARRRRQLEEEERLETERQRTEEEMERIKKEEEEREQEEKRVEKLRLDDNERMDRKRRLEQIMSRVKKQDESCAPNIEESVPVVMETSVLVEDVLLDMPENGAGLQQDREELVPEESEEHVAEGPESELPTTEDAAVLPANGSLDVALEESGIDGAPQFKSRLLQSMLASGRLATSNSDIRRNSSANIPSDIVHTNKRQSLILSPHNGNADSVEYMPHSRSFNCDMAKMSVSMIETEQSRSGLLYESPPDEVRSTNGAHHSDTENETLPSLSLGNTPTTEPYSEGGRGSMEERASPVPGQVL